MFMARHFGTLLTSGPIRLLSIRLMEQNFANFISALAVTPKMDRRGRTGPL